MHETANEETITMDEALSFIAAYCDWNPPPNEYLAARRLIADGITGEDLERVNLPGNSDLKGRIDTLIYGGSID